MLKRKRVAPAPAAGQSCGWEKRGGRICTASCPGRRGIYTAPLPWRRGIFTAPHPWRARRQCGSINKNVYASSDGSAAALACTSSFTLYRTSLGAVTTFLRLVGGATCPAHNIINVNVNHGVCGYINNVCINVGAGKRAKTGMVVGIAVVVCVGVAGVGVVKCVREATFYYAASSKS